MQSADTPDQCHFRFSTLSFAAISDAQLRARAAMAVPPDLLERPGRSDERRRAYWAGRAAAAVLLSDGALIRPDPQWGYLRVYTGKVEDKRHVNISHTSGMAAAVLGMSPVGIDIESMGRDASRVIRRAASATERQRMPKSLWIDGKEIRAEVAVWSAKEAVSKALGLGIKFGLQHFVIDLSSDPPFCVSSDISGPLHVKEPAVLLLQKNDHIIAICAERESLRNGVHDASRP